MFYRSVHDSERQLERSQESTRVEPTEECYSLTVDDAFVERRASATIERGAFSGENFDHLRQVVWKLLSNLEHAMQLGDRFSLDTVEPALDGTSPVYFEKTPHGLIITREEIPLRE